MCRRGRPAGGAPMTIAEQWAEVCRLWTETEREGSPWRPGMRSQWGRITIVRPPCEVEPGGVACFADEFDESEPGCALVLGHNAPHPDPDDDATRGALLGLVREVWGDPRAHVCPLVTGDWGVFFWDDRSIPKAPAEAEALLAALIAGLRREVTP